MEDNQQLNVHEHLVAGRTLLESHEAHHGFILERWPCWRWRGFPFRFIGTVKRLRKVIKLKDIDAASVDWSERRRMATVPCL